MRHRLAHANKSFYMDATRYHGKAVSLKEKLTRYVGMVQATTLHGAGRWAWTKAIHDRLRRTEGRVLVHMCGMSRPDDEPWSTSWLRAINAARLEFTKEGHTVLEDIT